MQKKITTQRRGHVLEIAFDRPEKYNGFDREMFGQLASAYGELEADPALRCGFVCGNGKHFTAGLDLPDWSHTFGSGAWPALEDGQMDPLGLDPAKRLTKPVVMAAHGICYTIGIELMLAADVRLCEEGTRFGQIEVKRGIYAVGGATVRMVAEFGWGNAQRYLLTGDDFDAREAHRIGLVQDVVAGADAVRAAGLALAERIARQAPLGVFASLKSSRIAVADGHDAAFARLMPDLRPIMASDDAAEGVRSFAERREANFSGR
jgi:enoyl-CoA hydratase/carnithine racemase